MENEVTRALEKLRDLRYIGKYTGFELLKIYAGSQDPIVVEQLDKLYVDALKNVDILTLEEIIVNGADEFASNWPTELMSLELGDDIEVIIKETFYYLYISGRVIIDDGVKLTGDIVMGLQNDIKRNVIVPYNDMQRAMIRQMNNNTMVLLNPIVKGNRPYNLDLKIIIDVTPLWIKDGT